MYSDIPIDTSSTSSAYVWNEQRPSKEMIYKWAQKTLSLLHGGFSWKDTGLIIQSSLEFSAEFSSLTLDDKRAIAIEMFDDLIDLTDTPYLPDSYTDPLFKAIVPLFVNLLINDRTKLWTVPHIDKMDLNSIPQTVQNILNSFKNGFQWTDLADITQFALFFSDQYPLLSSEEKAKIAKEIVNSVIDETDTPYVLDTISDPIFKAIIDPVIDTYFQLSKNL
jgi:hypothetical protein